MQLILVAGCDDSRNGVEFGEDEQDERPGLDEVVVGLGLFHNFEVEICEDIAVIGPVEEGADLLVDQALGGWIACFYLDLFELR
jgi:hypothetical protein